MKEMMMDSGGKDIGGLATWEDLDEEEEEEEIKDKMGEAGERREEERKQSEGKLAVLEIEEEIGQRRASIAREKQQEGYIKENREGCTVVIDQSNSIPLGERMWQSKKEKWRERRTTLGVIQEKQ